jgi:8-oxo-dGTP pyrophosphatase MutT (NUDIX family)
MTTIQGVGLILLTPTGDMFVIRERNDKPHILKKSGMLSMPLETIEEGETADEAIVRLISEEIGVVVLTPTLLDTFHFEYPPAHTSEITVYVAYTELKFNATPTSDDVEFYGWIQPESLLEKDHKRLEVQPILETFLKIA